VGRAANRGGVRGTKGGCEWGRDAGGFDAGPFKGGAMYYQQSWVGKEKKKQKKKKARGT